MNDQEFELIMERFDALDAGNEKLAYSLEEHAKKDEAVYIIVDRHATYWTFFIYIGGTLLVAGVSYAMGFLS